MEKGAESSQRKWKGNWLILHTCSLFHNCLFTYPFPQLVVMLKMQSLRVAKSLRVVGLVESLWLPPILAGQWSLLRVLCCNMFIYLFNYKVYKVCVTAQFVLSFGDFTASSFLWSLKKKYIYLHVLIRWDFSHMRNEVIKKYHNKFFLISLFNSHSLTFVYNMEVNNSYVKQLTTNKE